MGHDRPHSTDDHLAFAPESADAAAVPANAWPILIVDDEPDVYAATCMALRGLEILGRPLHFLHAASAAEAFERLRTGPDIAVILLDVVMESDNAGLDLVVRIRNDLKLHKPRIILRSEDRRVW